MGLDRSAAWALALWIGALAPGCSSDDNGKTRSNGGGQDGGGPGSSSEGGAQGDGAVVHEVSAKLSAAAADLRAACERIVKRERDCAALSAGSTRCAALTAAWFASDKGYGPELADLSMLDDAALRRELGVDERECKADCADAADCADVIAEDRDGACEGAADYKGSLDACRDLCENKFGGYACGDGQFVGDKKRCDGTADCANGQDEKCESVSFDCGGGALATRIQPVDLEPWNPKCDRKVDCPASGIDEKGCEHEAFACNAASFIAHDDVCDGKDQCMDGADEADCREFDCGDGERIPARGVCDSDVNCKNHADDLDCPGWFVCADGKGAVAGSDVCEIADLSDAELAALVAKDLAKLYDCPDKSDESSCARVICK